MPCYDPYQNDYDIIRISKDQVDQYKMIEAVLCGLARSLEVNNSLSVVLNHIDWREVGVKRSRFMQWFNDHKAKDEERRQREREEAETKRKIEEAKSKLTDEELKLLKLK